jgi:hypothetical protein
VGTAKVRWPPSQAPQGRIAPTEDTRELNGESLLGQDLLDLDHGYGDAEQHPQQDLLGPVLLQPLRRGGKTFKGQKSVTTNANGNASFSFSTIAKVAVGQRMTATATDAFGNTSEFSAPKAVVAQ